MIFSHHGQLSGQAAKLLDGFLEDCYSSVEMLKGCSFGLTNKSMDFASRNDPKDCLPTTALKCQTYLGVYASNC